MKKLSLLVALALLITVSGVYAVWTYGGGTMNGVNTELSHGMATATTDANAGHMEITNNSVMITIDQKASNDYTAVLHLQGSITVTFTPHAGASDTIKAQALPAEAVLSTTGVAEYMGTKIYKVDSTAIPLVWGEKKGDGTFDAVITADQIDSHLDLNANFVLDTHAEYLAFQAEEDNADILITFQPKTTP